MLLREITGVFSLTSLLLQLRHPAVESSRPQENKVHKDAGLGRKGGRRELALPLAPRFRLRARAALRQRTRLSLPSSLGLITLECDLSQCT